METTHPKQQALRALVFKLLQNADHGSWVCRAVDLFLIIIISVNVLAVTLETVETLHHQYSHYFYALEMFSVTVFSIEYILRVWSCVEDSAYERYASPRKKRLHFAITPMALIDLMAILPFYLAVIFQIDLRFLRVLRLFRIFKLTRYSGAMTMLLNVLREEMSNFAAAIFIMFVIMIIAASGIYLLEHDQQPDKFGSIPQSMWWAIVTLTTVGYGDVTPHTLGGRLFATAIMIAGVGLVALPTGILASSFSENLKRNRKTMRRELIHALEDGVIDDDERIKINNLKHDLGLSDEAVLDIQQSLLEYKIQGNNGSSSCPHCGKAIR